MGRLVFLVCLAALLVLLYSMSVPKVEKFKQTEIGKLMTHMSELDSTEAVLKERRYSNRVNIRKKKADFKEFEAALSQSYKQDVCDNVAQFEEMNTSNLSKATNQDGALVFKKTYHKGAWDTDTEKCISPFPKEQTCSDFTVDCATEGTNSLVHRIGEDDGDSCRFDSCPIYCLSYNQECYELRTRGGEHSFVMATGVRSNCVNPLDENVATCVEPVAENCPQKEFYYYEDDNSTITSNFATRTVDTSNVCRYTRDITDRPTFSTMASAMSNCPGMSAFKECYSPNGPGRFMHSTHRLDRFGCFHEGEPGICKTYSELSCSASQPYYTLQGSVFDSAQGALYKTYTSSTVPQYLSAEGMDYVCVHSQPTGTLTSGQLSSSCQGSCFLGDGTEPAVMKSGSMSANRSTCTISDCYATSQKVRPEDCPEESYYYYDTDNTTVLSSNKTKEVIQNACAYSTPTEAPQPNFDSEAAARSNCAGLPVSKVCYYEEAGGDMRAETHALNRNDCSYTGERSGCMSTVSTGSPCAGSTTYYKTDATATFDGSGGATKQVSSESVSNTLTASSPTHFVCSQGSPSPGFASQAACSIDCYTVASGASRTNVDGVVEGDRCVVSSDCYDSARVTSCSETSTYYKLGAGSYSGTGQHTFPMETETVSHTLANNACNPGSPSSGFGALPTDCSVDCYPMDGGPRRTATGSATPSQCVIDNCYETQQVTDCSESTTYYKLDTGRFDGAGNFEQGIQSISVPHVVENNQCVIAPAPSTYSSLPTTCSKLCYPADGGTTRTVTGTASSSNCLMTDCFETQQQTPAPVDDSGTPILSGYTFDDGSEYGISPENRYKMYYGTDTAKQYSTGYSNIGSAQECAALCDNNCTCMAFIYYNQGGISTNRSKNCVTFDLPTQASDMEIKESSRSATDAMRQVYKRDIYNTNVREDGSGKKYITDIPLVSESGCTPVDCSGSYTTYYKLDGGSYDGSGNYRYDDVLSSNVDDVVQSGECVPGPPPPGYGAQPTVCSTTCFPSRSGDMRIAQGNVIGTSCVIADCHETRQSAPSSPPVDTPPPPVESEPTNYPIMEKVAYKIFDSNRNFIERPSTRSSADQNVDFIPVKSYIRNFNERPLDSRTPIIEDTIIPNPNYQLYEPHRISHYYFERVPNEDSKWYIVIFWSLANGTNPVKSVLGIDNTKYEEYSYLASPWIRYELIIKWFNFPGEIVRTYPYDTRDQHQTKTHFILEPKGEAHLNEYFIKHARNNKYCRMNKVDVSYRDYAGGRFDGFVVAYDEPYGQFLDIDMEPSVRETIEHFDSVLLCDADRSQAESFLIEPNNPADFCEKRCYAAAVGDSKDFETKMGAMVNGVCEASDCDPCAEDIVMYSQTKSNTQDDGVAFTRTHEHASRTFSFAESPDGTCTTGSLDGWSSSLPPCKNECLDASNSVIYNVQGSYTGNRCLVDNCHTECRGSGTVYRDNEDGEYQSNDTYTFTQATKVVPYTKPPGRVCILDDPEYSATSTDCSAVCYDGTQSVTKSGSWDSTQTICTVPDCKACGATNNQADVYKSTFKRFDPYFNKVTFDMDRQSVSTTLTPSNTCEIENMPTGYSTTNGCSYDECYRTSGDYSSRYTKSGVVRGNKCYVENCLPKDIVHLSD